MSLPHSTIEAIAIGASAGAVEALLRILGPLPADYPLPIAIVVHLPADRESMLPELIANSCALAAREASDKEPLEASTIYFAPPDYHLLIEKKRCFSLSSEEPLRFSRPSIDILFETAADSYAEALMGIVLTGGNDDGARGLRAILDAGGVGLVQTPSSAYASSMPKSALRLCPDAQELSLDQITQRILDIGKS